MLARSRKRDFIEDLAEEAVVAVESVDIARLRGSFEYK
jgi:hypothetical protein